MARPDFTDWGTMLARVSNAWDTPINLAAAAGNYASLAVMCPIALNRVAILITTATTSGSVAGQVAFKRFPTYNSTSGSVSIGAITVPTAATVGQVYYKDLSYTKINAGEQLMVQIGVQQVDSGTAAGAGLIGFSFEFAPDADANQSNTVKSA